MRVLCETGQILPASAMDQETAYLKSNAGVAYEALGGLLAGGKGVLKMHPPLHVTRRDLYVPLVLAQQFCIAA